MPLDRLNYGLILKNKNHSAISLNLNEGNFDVQLLINELKRKNAPLPVCFLQVDRHMKTLAILDVYASAFTFGNTMDKKNPDIMLDDQEIEKKILVKNLCKGSIVELSGTIRSKKLEYGKQDITEDGRLFIGRTWILITRFGY